MAYDIKKDPRFLARTKQIESKANIKRLKDPVEIVIAGVEFYVIAIGINGSYLTVIPSRRSDGTHINPHMFSVWWTDKKSTVFTMGEIGKFMVSWLIVSDDTDFIEVAHRDVNPVRWAIEFMIKLRGINYFENGKQVISITDQGIEREIPNPFINR